jgi:hypothetical protein
LKTSPNVYNHIITRGIKLPCWKSSKHSSWTNTLRWPDRSKLNLV